MTRLAALLLLTCSGPAWAASTGPLPPEIQKQVAELDQECRGYGGKPAASPSLVQSADLTGDGAPDYVIDVGSYNCEGAASAMSAGQSGAAVMVFAGGPARKAYQGLVYGVKLDESAAPAKVYLDVAGVECGQRNAAKVPFSNWKFCSRPLVWNATKNAFAFGPLKDARPVGN